MLAFPKEGWRLLSCLVHKGCLKVMIAPKGVSLLNGVLAKVLMEQIVLHMPLDRF